MTTRNRYHADGSPYGTREPNGELALEGLRRRQRKLDMWKGSSREGGKAPAGGQRSLRQGTTEGRT